MIGSGACRRPLTLAAASAAVIVTLFGPVGVPEAGADDPWLFSTQPNPAAGGDTLTTDVTIDCPVVLGPTDVLVGETVDGANTVVDSQVLAGPGGIVTGPLSYSYTLPVGAPPGLWHRTVSLLGPGVTGPPECLPFGWGPGGTHSMPVEVVGAETPAAAAPWAVATFAAVALGAVRARQRRHAAH